MATKKKTSSSKEKAVRVKPREDVKIEYTEKAKHGKPGKFAIVHRVLADNLVKKGVAKVVELEEDDSFDDDEE